MSCACGACCASNSPQAACDAAWQQFLAGFAEHYLPFRASVQALAALDCLCSLATLASSPGWVVLRAFFTTRVSVSIHPCSH